jgi:hypothetical protein
VDPTGFEPATSRGQPKYQNIFTTRRGVVVPGNSRACTASREASAALTLSYRPNSAGKELNLRPADYRSNRALHHRRRIRQRGTDDPASRPSERESLSGPQSRVAPVLAGPAPRHVRRPAGFEPAFPSREVTGIFTTAAFRPPGRTETGPGEQDETGESILTKEPGSSPPGFRAAQSAARQSQKHSRRSHESRAAWRTDNVRPAIGGKRYRAPFPPAGPALRKRLATSKRVPGIRVSLPGDRPGNIGGGASGREKRKTPPEHRAREGPEDRTDRCRLDHRNLAERARAEHRPEADCVCGLISLVTQGAAPSRIRQHTPAAGAGCYSRCHSVSSRFANLLGTNRHPFRVNVSTASAIRAKATAV